MFNMVIAYVSGEIVFVDQPRDKTIILEFLKLFDGVYPALSISHGRTSVFSFLCTSEDDDLNKAQKTAEIKFNKFYEFIKVVMPYRIQIRTELIRGDYNLGDPKVSYEKFPNLLDTISNDEFERYLINTDISESRLLIEAINDYDDKKYFDAFAKLVNYSDDVLAVQRFCGLRDSVSHREVNRARPRVEAQFPNEFEFNGDSFVRDSSKNIDNLKKYWPMVLKEAQAKFRSMVKNS